MVSTKADRKLIRELDGQFVNKLSIGEFEAFQRCIYDEVATRDYSDGDSFLDMSKIKYIHKTKSLKTSASFIERLDNAYINIFPKPIFVTEENKDDYGVITINPKVDIE